MAITLVAIMLNEEEVLPAFLENIKGVFPHNIFVDGGSTDKSVELVEQAGYSVYYRKFDLDFASQKNFGLDLAPTQWRMILDIDETLSVGMKHLFQVINVTHEEDPLVGWSFLRDNYIDGNFIDVFPPDQQIRLISDQIKMVGRIHEKPETLKGYRVYDGGRLFHRKTSFQQYRANFIYEMIMQERTEAPSDIGCYMEGIKGQGGRFRIVNLRHTGTNIIPSNEHDLLREYSLDTYEI